MKKKAELPRYIAGEQLKMFDYPKCSVCGRCVEVEERGGIVANAFLDNDTKEIVHMDMSCKKGHYVRKAANGMRGLYSEVPVIIND